MRAECNVILIIEPVVEAKDSEGMQMLTRMLKLVREKKDKVRDLDSVLSNGLLYVM
jgi:hypothetical protein